MKIATRDCLALLFGAGLAVGASSQPFLVNDEPGLQEHLAEQARSQPPAEAWLLAQPMPMPNDAGMPDMPSDPALNRPIYKDMLSGAIIQGDLMPMGSTIPFQETEAMSSPFGASGDEFNTRNMNALSLISNPEAAPWNINCKLLMRFGSSYYVCSGTLIDRRTVLTAGHCINEGSGGAWADEVWVFPGYENNDGTSHQDSDAPFGSGKSVGLASWTGWTVSSDYQQDIAWIRLDRPIGMISGHHGYGYNTSCSFYTTSNTWHNASYPAEAAYGWNGNFMYYRFGTFDSCIGDNRIQYDSAGYGGMSGSSNYYIPSGRIAHGVASTSDRSTYTRHCKFWQSSFEYVRDTFIDGAKPGTYDLWAMWTRNTSGSTSVTAGNTISVNGIVGNWSNAAYNGNVPYSYRLSTNDLISVADTSLATGSFSHDFGTTGSVFAPARTLTIPKNTPSGTRWIGLLIDNSDASTGNNDSSGQDALQISVSAIADPEVSGFQNTSGTFFLGSNISVQASFLNAGALASNSITMSVRASTNNILSTGDPEIASFTYGGITGNGSFTTPVESVNLPASLGVGARYIGIIISSANDADVSTTSNYWLNPTPITLEGRPDIAVTAFDAANGNYYHGQIIPVTDYDITNVGTAATGTIPLEIRVSTNNIISTADTLANSASVGGLNPGEVANYSWSFQVPGTLAAGNYYAGARIPTLTNEVVTANNTLAEAATFTIIDCLADVNNDGLISPADFSAWIASYNTASLGCDQNGDGACTPADFSAWISNYNTGCPGL